MNQQMNETSFLEQEDFLKTTNKYDFSIRSFPAYVYEAPYQFAKWKKISTFAKSFK